MLLVLLNHATDSYVVFSLYLCSRPILGFTHVMRRHVGVQNNGKMSLNVCVIVESNSQNTFFAFVLYTNMAAVMSREKREFSVN